MARKYTGDQGRAFYKARTFGGLVEELPLSDTTKRYLAAYRQSRDRAIFVWLANRSELWILARHRVPQTTRSAAGLG